MRCGSGRLAPWSELSLLQAKWAPQLPLSGPLLLSYLAETWLRGRIRWSFFSEMSASFRSALAGIGRFTGPEEAASLRPV